MAFDPMSLYNIANAQGWQSWIMLGIDVIVSTIIGGFILLLIVELFSHKFNEPIKPGNAFLVVLIANVINFLGIIGILGMVLPGILLNGFGGIALNFLVWLGLLKGFFADMGWAHVLIIALVMLGASVMITPLLSGIIMQFIPMSF